MNNNRYIFQPEGLLWIVVGLLFAMVPVLLIGIISTKFCGVSYASNIGMLCGAMANPIALNYALSTVENKGARPPGIYSPTLRSGTAFW